MKGLHNINIMWTLPIPVFKYLWVQVSGCTCFLRFLFFYYCKKSHMLNLCLKFSYRGDVCSSESLVLLFRLILTRKRSCFFQTMWKKTFLVKLACFQRKLVFSTFFWPKSTRSLRKHLKKVVFNHLSQFRLK